MNRLSFSFLSIDACWPRTHVDPVGKFHLSASMAARPSRAIVRFWHNPDVCSGFPNEGQGFMRGIFAQNPASVLDQSCRLSRVYLLRSSFAVAFALHAFRRAVP